MEKDIVKFDWPKEAVLHMIGMWQKYECLYNPKDKFYHNKHARYAAFNEISAKLKDLNFDIGSTDIKNKMTYLGGQYTREVAKQKERKSGAGAEENYFPSAYWYTELAFLEDFIRIRKGGCNLISQVSLDDSFDSLQPIDCDESPQTSKRKRNKETAQPNQYLESQENEVLSAATAALNKIGSGKTNLSDEKDDSFCNFIKSELSEIKCSEIKDELKEIITLEIFKSKKKQRMQDKCTENFTNSLF